MVMISTTAGSIVFELLFRLGSYLGITFRANSRRISDLMFSGEKSPISIFLKPTAIAIVKGRLSLASGGVCGCLPCCDGFTTILYIIGFIARNNLFYLFRENVLFFHYLECGIHVRIRESAGGPRFEADTGAFKDPAKVRVSDSRS